VIQGNTAVLQDQPPVLFYNKDEDEPLTAIVVQAVNFIRAGVPYVHIFAQEEQYRDMRYMEHVFQLIRSFVDTLTTSHADELMVTINVMKPDVVAVALGQHKQEQFIKQARERFKHLVHCNHAPRINPIIVRG